MPVGSKMDLPLAKAEPFSNSDSIFKKGKKKPAQLQPGERSEKM